MAKSKTVYIQKIVLDVLKPHKPGIPVLAKSIASVYGVDGVNISVYEIDQKVENVKITIEGKVRDLEDVTSVITHSGATIHSVDEIVAGKVMVSEEETLSERYQEK